MVRSLGSLASPLHILNLGCSNLESQYYVTIVSGRFLVKNFHVPISRVFIAETKVYCFELGLGRAIANARNY